MNYIFRRSMYENKMESVLLSPNTFQGKETRSLHHADVLQIVQQELTEKEILQIDMRFLGKIVLAQAKMLSAKVNRELLEPISVWLNDPEWMKKFQEQDIDVPDWAAYKKRSRQWDKSQRCLAQERLKQYWKAIREKRLYRETLSGILHAGRETGDGKAEKPYRATIDTAFLSDLVTPFSPIERHRTETALEFRQAHTTTISDLLPWRAMIVTELPETGSTTFRNLKVFVPDDLKKDKVSKLQHLLQMDKDGEIQLIQEKHAGPIQIIQESWKRETKITIKDQSGQTYRLEWLYLNDSQKTKIITDAIKRKILVKSK